MTNTDLYLCDIANNLKSLEVGCIDTDGIEQELAEINDTLQDINDNISEKLDKLIEVLSNE